MANEQNLMPIEAVNSRRTREKHSADSRKAGIRSGEVRRARRTYKELFEQLLSLPIQDENTRDYLLSMGFKEEHLNNDLVEVVTMHQEVLKGNVRAYEAIRDTVGERPSDKLTIEEAPQIILKRPEK